MSNIIDQDVFIQKSPYSQLFQNVHVTEEKPKQRLKYNKDEIIKILSKLVSTIDCEYFIESSNVRSKQDFNLKLIYYNVGLNGFNMMIDIYFNLHAQYISTYVGLLNEQKPFKIQSSDHRILGSKIFSKTYINNLNKISILMSNGSFKIVRPTLFYLNRNCQDIFHTKCKQKNLLYLIKNDIRECVKSCKPFLKLLHFDVLQDPLTNIKKYQHLMAKTIFRYIIRSPIEPAFDVSFGSGKYDTMEKLTKQQISNTNNAIQNIVTDFQQFSSHSLYLTPGFPLDKLKSLYKRQYFIFNDDELSALKQKAMPPASNRSNMESKYIYNMIELNQTIPIQQKKINSGGFSDIFKAQVDFWYMISVSSQQMEKLDDLKQRNTNSLQLAPTPKNEVKSKKQNKKVVVFKTNNMKGMQVGRNRINHQMKIVQKFKGASSLFLPEYFKIVNQHHQLSKNVIMQFLPYPTLSQYLDMNKNTMSFLTKIHLASLIMQALRFLKNYQIVHMDLKPSNIIISKRLIVKLIDFGESYNRQICERNFKAAFSFPYGCPEIFDIAKNIQFNQKNDVYSWGVILFQLLFKKWPFTFSKQKKQKMFKQKNYMDYIYFVPEQEEMYGTWEMMPLLRNIAFRSLDKQQKNRPCTLWLTVILKECLSYFINLETNITNI